MKDDAFCAFAVPAKHNVAAGNLSNNLNSPTVQKEITKRNLKKIFFFYPYRNQNLYRLNSDWNL